MRMDRPSTRTPGIRCAFVIPFRKPRRPKVAKWIFTIAMLALMGPLGGTALAQRHQIGTVNAETPEGALLQQICQAADESQKLGLMEQFASQYPKHEAIGWVREQMQTAYLKAGQPD